MKTLATMAFAASLATFAGEPPALPRPAAIVRGIAYAPENGAFGLCDLWLPASPQPDVAALPASPPLPSPWRSTATSPTKPVRPG